jgi:hypothetical protein
LIPLDKVKEEEEEEEETVLSFSWFMIVKMIEIAISYYNL